MAISRARFPKANTAAGRSCSGTRAGGSRCTTPPKGWRRASCISGCTARGCRAAGHWYGCAARRKRENWLLIKDRDDHAGRSRRRAGQPAPAQRHHRANHARHRCGTRTASRRRRSMPAHGPRFRAVQLATLQDSPPEGEGWRHEPKFDGYRCLIAIGKGGASALHPQRQGLDRPFRAALSRGGRAALQLRADRRRGHRRQRQAATSRPCRRR